jgi:phage-related protein
VVALAEAFVRVRADTRGFRRETEREAVTAGKGAGEKFGDGFTRGADGKLRDSRGRFVGAGEAAGQSFSKGFNRGTSKGTKGGGAFASALALSAAKATIFGGAAGAAAPAVLKLVGALAPAAGAAIALPAALAAGAAAMGTLKLATAGVGDAIKEGFTGNAKQAAEALKKLSPEAREFAKSVIVLKGRLNTLQDTTADHFFRRFNTQVQPLARVYMPILNRQLPILAGAMGGVAKQFAVAARQGVLLQGVRAVLGNTATAAAALGPAMRPALAALGRLLTVGAPTIRQLGIGFSDAAVRASRFVTEAAKTGRLAGWLEAGKQTLRDLAGILGNVGSIFTSVVRAANAGGTTLLATLRGITGQVAAFLKSAQGSEALTAVFATLARIGAAIRTSLGAALPAVAQSLAALGPTIAMLAGTAAQFVVALAPLLPAFSRLAATLIDAIIPALAALAGWLNRHQTVLKVVAAAVGSLYLAITLYSAGVKVAAAATALWTTITKIAAVVTKVWTVTTAALGVAMRFALGPIGLIITAVGLLVAGIVYAYRNHEGFRNLVQKVWQAIQVAASWAWNNVLKPIFAAWKYYLVNVVAPAMLWLWNNVLKPAWAGISAAASFAWNHVIKPVFAGWKAVITNVIAPAVMWFWNNIVKPAFAGIKWAANNLWVVLQVIFAAWRLYIAKVLIPALQFLWNAAKVSFTLIGNHIRFVWNVLIKPVFNLLKAGFGLLVEGIRIGWGRLRAIFSLLGGFLTGTVAPAFRKGVDAIRTAWAKVQEAARKPVAFVVNQVINPLARGFNKVAGALGVKGRIAEIGGFASGGRIPGAPSRRDNLLAAAPGGLLKVATGEFVTNARSTAANLPLIKAINAARGPVSFADLDPHLDGRADGGIIGRIKGLAGNVWDAITNPGKLLKAPLDAALKRIPGAGGMADVAKGMGRKLIDGLMGFIGRTGVGLGGGSVGGWSRMRALIAGQFPGLGMISGLRRGATTLSGNRSYHALGRAVDYPPSRALASWIRTRFGKNTKELITPFQDLNLLNGRPHTYTGAVWNQHNFAGGNSHVHWAAALGGLIGKRSGLNLPFGAYDTGGLLPRGLSLAYNGTGAPERVGGGDTHIHLHNHGVIGSQRDMDRWLAAGIDRVQRDRKT